MQELFAVLAYDDKMCPRSQVGLKICHRPAGLGIRDLKAHPQGFVGLVGLIAAHSNPHIAELLLILFIGNELYRFVWRTVDADVVAADLRAPAARRVVKKRLESTAPRKTGLDGISAVRVCLRMNVIEEGEVLAHYHQV